MNPILLTVAFSVLLLITFLILFVSRRTSPIPYFPSNAQDIPLIISALNLRNNQILYELGAGDGIVAFRAASAAHKRLLNTQFVAIEINPLLILVMHVRRLFHPNKHNISIQRADIFTANYQLKTHNSKLKTRNLKLVTRNFQETTQNQKLKTKNLDLVFFTYISPWYMQKTVANVASQLPDSSAARWVSYFYDVPTGAYGTKRIGHAKGINEVFTYELSKKRARVKRA